MIPAVARPSSPRLVPITAGDVTAVGVWPAAPFVGAADQSWAIASRTLRRAARRAGNDAASRPASVATIT